jgi:hypothetical protein
MAITRLCWAPGIVIVLAGAGCSDSSRVYPVSGRITLDGKPMAGGGSISFIPIDGNKARTSGGEIAADGTYRLTTFKIGDGAMAGRYRVVVTQVLEKPSSQVVPDGGPVTRVDRTLNVSDDDRIPEIYSDHRKSPLTATVEGKKANEIDLELNKIRPEGLPNEETLTTQ